ncbi:MAG TPA: TonB-dependent receptor plug domain-containing protein [Candidatus Eisenbacteria bacterium]|nr:TonB-dependent receptor plug domain-containing protein [Candidatus Eisenbacteria bacterium]
MPLIRAALLAAVFLGVVATARASTMPAVADSSGPAPDSSGPAPDSSDIPPAPDSIRYSLPGVDVRAPRFQGIDPRADFITREQIGRTAATADDAFRVVQTLPGVASSDYAASFLVRGGESDETLVRFDGFDLLEPYHIPYWGGAISVVSPDVVQTMQLSRGGLPARYGRELSGALEIQSPSDRPEGPRYQVGAGPTQLRALVAGPTKGGGSYLLGIRHGLLAAIGRLHRLDRDASIVPDFQDLIGEARLRPAEGHEVTFLALGARERLRYDMPYDENDLNGSVRNLTLGASWSYRPSERVQHRLVFSADRFHRATLVGRSGRDDSVTRALRARLEGELSLGRGKALEWGAAAEYEDGWLALDGIRGSLGTSGYQEEVEHVIAGTAIRRRGEAYLSARASAGSRATVTAGVNVSRDLYAWGLRQDGAPLPGTPGFAFVSPRLGVLARLGSAGSAWASMGLMRQPSLLNNLERESLPLGRNREAAETAAGFEVAPAGARFRVEGYLRKERGAGLPAQDVTAQPSPPFALDRGTARGVELSLRTPSWARADASLGYTLSRALWTAPEGIVPRSFDQRHAAALSLNVRPAAGWNLNVLARYHTGSPYTASVWARDDSTGTWTRGFGTFMGARYPAYFRLDFRLSHPLSFGPTGGQAYVELINATGRVNVHQYTYVFDPGADAAPRLQAVELFPRMPAAGFEFSF